MGLPPFNRDAQCPKCGSGMVRALFHAAGVPVELNKVSDVLRSRLEFKCDVERRSCETCDYRWAELPLDAAKE